MLLLKDILIHIDPVRVAGDTSVEITDVSLDSRNVSKGTLFMATKGTVVDSHEFIGKAVDMGASAVMCEVMPGHLQEGVVYVQVKNSAEAAGHVASSFYGEPSRQMKVVGVTGTNGKTTTATLLYKLFEALGYKSGLISTVQNHIHTEIVPSTHTTPDPVSLQSLLARMAEAGCEYVFMEVSSHAVHQHRIAGIHYAGGIFTNITHDHLDYHKTFDEYIRVKKSFFDGLPADAFALTNADDKRGMVMLQNTAAEKHAYSLKAPASFKGKILENNLTGLVMMVNNHEAHFRMIGTFNAYNLLAVYGAAKLLGEDELDVLSALSDLHGVPGRFETFLSPEDKVLGVVDYAHTPDALINVLATVKQLRKEGQQIITVVGCGGDRDKTKRPIMAEVACEHSDRVILTADNPRTEDPEMILNDMETGITMAHKRKVLRISDRREAIKTACALSHPVDIILIAGKGHETYQEIKGVKHPFDDREVLLDAFKTLNK